MLSAPHEATAASAVARLAPDAAADVAGWIVADNADPATPGRLVATARDRFGRLDGAVGGSLTGAGGSIVFVLASSVRVPLAELAISNGLSPGLAGVVKTLAGEPGPAGIRVNGILPVRIATDRSVSPHRLSHYASCADLPSRIECESKGPSP